jgi:hypothetical protein
MFARLLEFVGAILVILGVLKLVGIFSIGTASAVALLVIGFIFVLAAEFLFSGGFLGVRRGPRV